LSLSLSLSLDTLFASRNFIFACIFQLNRDNASTFNLECLHE
jgi:hypothetical protein